MLPDNNITIIMFKKQKIKDTIWYQKNYFFNKLKQSQKRMQMGFKLCTPTRAFASTISVCHSDQNTHFTDVQGGMQN